MRVVVLSPYAPHGGTGHAGGAYLHAYLSRAAAVRDVTLVAPDTPENRRGRDLHGTRAEVHLVASDSTTHPVTMARNLARGLTPGEGVMRGMAVDEQTHHLLRTADLVEVHWSYMLPLLALVPPHTPMVAFPYDVVAQAFQRKAKHSRNPARRLILLHKAWRIQRQEVTLLNRAGAVFVFSQKDIELLTRHGLTAPAHVIDPLVELPPEPSDLDSQNLLFVGAMGRYENVDAVRWFLDECWPTVSGAVPGASVTIAGSDPPDQLTRPGVAVTGFVEDLSPYYRQARLAIAPIRLGAGLKFKVPQALAWGLPVVATSVGAEGLPAEIFAGVTDDASEFAESCVNVLLDVQRARQVGRRGRAWALERYDLARSIDSVLSTTEAMTRK